MMFFALIIMLQDSYHLHIFSMVVTAFRQLNTKMLQTGENPSKKLLTVDRQKLGSRVFCKDNLRKRINMPSRINRVIGKKV